MIPYTASESDEPESIFPLVNIGLASLSNSSAGGVAYWAHVGGFVTGLALVKLFTQPDRVQQLRAYHSGAYS